MNLNHHLPRRIFLRQASCAAVTSNSIISTLLNMKAANAAAMSNSSVLASGNYKALVCIFLEGGNDSFNMLAPKRSVTGNLDEYNAYSNIRSELALQESSLLVLNASNIGDRVLGLHPAMPYLQALFNSGDAAFVANVGTLIQPTIASDVLSNEPPPLPLGLLSHSDQAQQWMTALPHERAGIGWGGRIADMINDMYPNNNLSMGISMSGTNIFQTGGSSASYSMNGYAPILDDEGNPNTPLKGIEGYNDEWEVLQVRRNAIDNILSRNYADIYENTYANLTKGGVDGWKAYESAFQNVTMNTPFVSLTGDMYAESNSLGWVAKMIGARDQLGYQRQTFFVQMGGWDHHDELINAQAAQLAEVDYAINQFQTALREPGIDAEDCVVTFVISDFARTLGSNGNGSDHAWGGNVMVVGKPVHGGLIYGNYPDTLEPSQNPVDLGGGIIVPTTSADVYFAQLAEWFGVSKSDLGTIFPNLGNFYDYINDPNPLNFLNV